MTITLGFNHYGKNDVHVSKITRGDQRNGFTELTVQTRLVGDFETAHTEGDNSNVLPTDTQKNTVYALASKNDLEPIEGFARTLAEHFTAKDEISEATVTVVQRRWNRIETSDGAHPTAFVQGSPEVRTCEVEVGNDLSVSAGIDDLVVLKTADSAFVGYLKDEYTTLPETRERIFCTSITAEWDYPAPDGVDFESSFNGVRNLLLEVFANHQSESVQHTLWAMGKAVLESHDEIGEIKLTMPNVHHNPVDVSRLGETDHNEVFEPTTAPAGFIEAVVLRE